MVEEWRTGVGPRPALSRPCTMHGCGGGIVQDLPDDVTRAAEEVRLPGGVTADVVLYRGEVPAVAVEILVHSAVNEEKARKYRIPWVELRAEDLLDRPYWWVAVQDGLRPFTCRTCVERVEGQEEELDAIRERAMARAGELGVGLPGNPAYRPVAHACWQCGSSMLVFHWPGSGGRGARRPPEPIPSTVRYRVTGRGDRWVNECPQCGVVQGDHHLANDNADYARVRELSDETWG